MPIQVPIYINQRLVKTYHIGRLHGDTDPDSINTYIIVAAGLNDEAQWADGLEFTHRYGDGLEACVAKGLAALERKSINPALERLNEFKEMVVPEG